MVCAGCAKDSVVTIRMRVGGEEVTFRRCSRCEVNVWEGVAGELGLERVLELAARK